MSVLTRDALEASPLADLHAIAAELGVDGFRRLRKADLIDQMLEAAGGEAAPAADADEAPAPRRRTRGGRSRAKAASADADADAEGVEDTASKDADADEEAPRPRSRRGGRGGRGRAAAEDEESQEAPGRDDVIVSGVVEVLGNGSGFLRVSPPDPSDDDVYISAAQVRRCELVSGDTVSGPRREPRRSERYPSLVRVDTINDRPADEVAEGTRFEDLAATFPTERFALGGEDVTLKAIEWLTPIGRGSRVTISGAARSGKTEALLRLAGALAGQDGVETSLVLAGVRPEELASAPEGVEPVAALPFSASADARGQAIERALDAAKRVVARGGHAVVLIDTLDGVHESVARRALAAARNVVDGGSLTVIATASAPLGGETTVIALDQTLTSTGRLPALDLVASGTLKPELLVGAAGAEAIASARASALA
ncbi:transcription termination factor Rho [Conexibacter sp. W3-3-2]|uniref:Transcription termination factor Rho n=1 Tax=Paraconexibacter algicola TaxID=2133960 RepID=A0A2T4UDB0_9ACTN|nr:MULTISPECIES: Rho termination factor N-terminal domain-containing protein [Solirubrobacterales]MTD43558.1 transcription termination factor Rho [Conexibacter sp. W3-3-2]PTL55488.1 transcription termination factor Rho [Paraconexibacter algicola]